LTFDFFETNLEALVGAIGLFKVSIGNF